MDYLHYFEFHLIVSVHNPTHWRLAPDTIDPQDCTLDKKYRIENFELLSAYFQQ